MKKEASFSGIFGELFSLVADARREFAVYTLVIGGLTALGMLAGLTETPAGSIGYGMSIDTDDAVESTLFELFSAVAGVVAFYFLLRRLLALRGRLHRSESRFWPYVAMSIVSAIAIIVGLILLVVPGLFLATRWAAASGFLIGEGRGVSDSLAASWNATKGHGWAIFLAGLSLLIGALVASVVLGGIAGLLGATAVGLVSSFIQAAAGGLFAGFGIAVFCLVHDDAQELGEVFA